MGTAGIVGRTSDLGLLHPRAARAFNALAVELAQGVRVSSSLELRFFAFETYRHPAAQEFHYKNGTSKARAYQSAHQFGLAVDFVPQINGKWTWEPPGGDMAWDALDKVVSTYKDRGLRRPISWDRPHIEHELWETQLRWLMK